MSTHSKGPRGGRPLSLGPSEAAGEQGSPPVHRPGREPEQRPASRAGSQGGAGRVRRLTPGVRPRAARRPRGLRRHRRVQGPPRRRRRGDHRPSPSRTPPRGSPTWSPAWPPAAALVVLEATGRLEAAVVAALAAAGLAVAVINPRQARDFAKAVGRWPRPTRSTRRCWPTSPAPSGRRSARCPTRRPASWRRCWTAAPAGRDADDGAESALRRGLRAGPARPGGAPGVARRADRAGGRGVGGAGAVVAGVEGEG